MKESIHNFGGHKKEHHNMGASSVLLNNMNNNYDQQKRYEPDQNLLCAQRVVVQKILQPPISEIKDDVLLKVV